MLAGTEFARVLDWPGYRVWRHENNERAKTAILWVRRKPGNREIECFASSRKTPEIHDIGERTVRDLPPIDLTITVFIEV